MVNRYQDLLNAVPKGQFYDAAGEILPYTDKPPEFRFTTTKPNTIFHVALNSVDYGTIKTDANGVAIVLGRDKFTRQALDPGEYDISIVDQQDGQTLHFYVTIKNIATWFAMYADVLEQLDDEITDMDNARTLANAPQSYIESAFGRALRQPRPTTFLIEDYRNMLRQLRQAYRHFGGHPFGLSQAVESFTSVSPLLVPQAWRPHWILGLQLIDNNKFQERSRENPAEFGPAGALTTSPIPELANINRQSRYWVHAAVGLTSPASSAFRAPPFAQRLTVTLNTPGQSVTITGKDESGATVTEIVPDPSIVGAVATYETETSFDSVTSAVRIGGLDVQIGLSESRFARITDIGSYNRAGASVDLTYYGRLGDVVQLSWGVGPITEVRLGAAGSVNANGISAVGKATAQLHDADRNAWAIATIESLGTYNLDPRGNLLSREYHDRLGIEIDGHGLLRVHIGKNAPTDPDNQTGVDTDVVARINAALTADPRYGASYVNLLSNVGASMITGTQGDNKDVLSLKSKTAGLSSRVKIHPVPSDASPDVLGLAFPTTRLAFPISGGSPRALMLPSGRAARFPAVSTFDATTERQFKIRIRGLRYSTSSGSAFTAGITYPNDGTATAAVAITLSGYTFTPSDIGGHVRWEDASYPLTNSGMHTIIAVGTSTSTPFGTPNGAALVLHESSITGGRFALPTASAGAGAVYHPGETRTVVDSIAVPNRLLTGVFVPTPLNPTPYLWPAGAVVELADDNPYEAHGSVGLGTIDLELDAAYRPFRDFGDSITFANTTDSFGGMRLTSSRADFSDPTLIGFTIRVSGTENLENVSPANGFVITNNDAVNGKYVDFANLNGLEEGTITPSNFEWNIDDIPFPATVPVDTLTISGADMPDGWQVTSASTTVVTTNTDSNAVGGVPGLFVPSKVELTGPSVQFQRDVPRALAYRGLPLDLSIWVQEHSLDGTEYKVEVSFNGGTDFHTIIDGTVNATVSASFATGTQFVGPQDPSELHGTFFVPFDATTCILRLTRSPSSATVGTVSIEQMALRSPTGTGLYTGDNTIVRSQKRTKFGELLYVWSAEPLIDEERKYLGLPIAVDALPNANNSIGVSTAKQPGHIDYITNAHGYYDRFDVSELDDSGSMLLRKNLRGVYDSTNWLDLEAATTLTNVEVVIGTPSRMSYVRPTRISAVSTETLGMVDGGDGPGTARATLSQPSNHDGSLAGPAYPQAPNSYRGTGARLYEAKGFDTTLVNADGLVTLLPAGTLIPMTDEPDDASIQPWEFMSASQIRINAPYFDAASTYLLDYDVLIRATSETFQLAGPGMTPADYLWMLDLSAYRRHEVIERYVPRSEQAQFIGDFTAKLSEHADITTSTATLTRNSGFVQTVVNFADWNFVDSTHIKILPTVFDNTSIYTISYTAKVPHVQPVPRLMFEWRAAEDENDLLTDAVAWTQVGDSNPDLSAAGLAGAEDRLEPPFVITPYFGAGDNVTLNQTHAWHQVRVTAFNVTDVRDFRLYGMGVKGIHLFGPTAHAPGILTP